MEATRRDFVKESLAALGFLALDGLPVFAAPPGWKPRKKPDIVFGVLTDTHLMTEWDAKSVYWTMSLDYIKNAYRHFKKVNVDAVLHLGDAAHRAQLRALEFHREEFDKVFGAKNPPPLLVVDGNHEWQGDWDFLKNLYKDPAVFKENVLTEDFPRLFEKGWGVKYEKMWHKEVKGFHFFGRGWGIEDGEFGKFIRSEAERCNLKGEKPFFILSHKMTYFRCNHQLREYPNAIGFCGHWHTSLANWGSIYYERNYKIFPYINCGACRYDGENGLDAQGLKNKPDPQRDSKNRFKYKSYQGMVVSVYDGKCIVIDRREFGKGGSLGPEWVFPIGRGTGNGERGKEKRPSPFSREELMKAIGEPQFRKRAKLVVSTGSTRFRPHQNPDNPVNPVKKESPSPCIKMKIPMADGSPDSRVYAYEVEIVGSDRNKPLCKSVYFEGVNCGIGHEPNKGVTTMEISKSELPKGRRLTISVTPLSSLGTKGKPILARFNA